MKGWVAMTPRILVPLGLTAAFACGPGETTTGPAAEPAEVEASGSRITVSLVPKVDGFVEDGTTVIDNSIVQTLHVPGFEDRGIIEFDMRGITGPVLKATLVLPVYASTGPYPFRIDVLGYRGNGRLDVDDWARGSLITSFQYTGESLVRLDVTTKVRGMQSTGANYAGFVFRFAVPSDISLNGPFVAFRSLEYPPAAKLKIATR
jgi:hypothetical protein